MAQLPETMKAWIVTRAGKPGDVLRLETNWPMPPPPRAGEVLIQVSHVALNPGEIKMMNGIIPWKGKAIAGFDYCGEVIQLGPSTHNSTSDFRIGTVVAGTVPFSKILNGAGTLAEYIILPSDQVVEKPKRLPEAVAAGIMGVAGQTAAAVLTATGSRQGDKVLVNGASGGVGSIIIQILDGMGVQVTGVCSARNLDLVKRLGGGEAVDYNAHASLYDHLSSLTRDPKQGPFDAIIDCFGNDSLFHQSPGYLKATGKYFSIEGGPLGHLTLKRLPQFLGGTPRAFVNVFSRPDTASAIIVREWFEKGWFKEQLIDSQFQMDDALQAFERMGTNRAVGKIIVEVV